MGTRTMDDLKHIRSEAKIFLMRHNNRQDWKYRKTDLETIPHRKLPEDFKIGANGLPITEGKVHFIRQVKEGGAISVLNEDFDADKSLAYESQLWKPKKQPQPFDYPPDPKKPKTKSTPQPLSVDPSKHVRFRTYSTL